MVGASRLWQESTGDIEPLTRMLILICISSELTLLLCASRAIPLSSPTSIPLDSTHLNPYDFQGEFPLNSYFLPGSFDQLTPAFITSTVYLPIVNKGYPELQKLRCEYLENPMGIEAPAPRLSWQIAPKGYSQRQTAYQVLVASSRQKLDNDEGDCWDSGKVETSQSAHVAYAGKSLSSNARYFWKVRIWDQENRISGWSEPAMWTMGLLKQEYWKALWITDGRVRFENNKRLFLPAAYMRKAFRLDKTVRRATVYVSAFGLYELYVNGKRVSEDYFTPGWSQYNKRVFYRSYDVTDMLDSGEENVIGAIVGDGWYVLFHRGDKIKLLVQLNVEFTDGTSQIIPSDGTWKVAPEGPILSSDIYDGEIYDARKEMPGWNEPGYDDSGWGNVTIVDVGDVKLSAHRGAPVQKIMELDAIALTEPEPGVFIFDLGQNFAGWARLKVKGEAGTKVTLRFGEALNADGTLFTGNLWGAKSTDEYILKGGGGEVWEPRFTYHGFRYVEVTGYPGRPEIDAVKGVVLHSNLPVAGEFECSNELLNRLYKNTLWSQRSNYFEVPTDCPQRRERLGWTGDAQIFIRTGAYNMKTGAFFTNWLRTLQDVQNEAGAYPDIAPLHGNYGTAGWGDAGIICPFTLYQMYGDKRIIEDLYDNMAKYISYLESESTNYLRATNCWPDDWGNVLAPTHKDVITNAYFAYSASLMAKMARAIGKTEDADKYETLANNVKKAFNEAYVAKDGKIVGDTQTTYLMALGFDLLPEEKRNLAANHLIERIEDRNWHLSIGFLGANLLLPVLTEIGRIDVAYRLLLNTDYPSWGYSVVNGATTIWEFWDTWRPETGWSNTSQNHYVHGSICEWFYSTIAGISAEEPGFQKIIIRPRPGGGLSWAKAGYESIYGKILSHWEIKNGNLTLNVTIPPNTTATIYFPVLNSESGKTAAESHKGIEYLGLEDGFAVFSVGSGEYSFTSPSAAGC